MHGRLKVRTSEEEKKLKAQERAKKLVAYKHGMAAIFKKRENKEFDDEALNLTSTVLMANPDISTLWNFRREIILDTISRKKDDDEYLKKMFDSELQLTEYCLKVNPKSYSAWHHRVWILDTRNDPNWEAEIKLCARYLNFDERNFHCWDYRLHIATRAKINLFDEFEFSTEKINDNFSNYSAWHYRSKLLAKLFPDEKGVRFIKEDCHRNELELVLNAAFTDPNDTSAWFYQRWLLGYSKFNLHLAVFRITPEQSFVAFNDNVLIENVKIKILVNNIEVIGVWKSLFGFKSDKMWILEHTTACELKDSDSINCILTIEEEQRDKLDGCVIKDIGIVYNSASFGNCFGESLIEELKNQQDSCKQLLELEPDSKWTNLAMAVISHSIDNLSSYKMCIDLCKTLSNLDSKRKHYYEDLASRWYIEYFLECKMDLVKKGKFTFSDENEGGNIQLTTLYHLQYWSACSDIDLSNQRLTSRCLSALKVLQNCEVLDLRGNEIESFKEFPHLPKLKKIYISKNKIDTSSEDFLSFKNSKSFKIE